MLVIVHVNRDSVHAGDDLESHATKVEVDSESDIGSLMKDLKSRFFQVLQEEMLLGLSHVQVTAPAWLAFSRSNGRKLVCEFHWKHL